MTSTFVLAAVFSLCSASGDCEWLPDAPLHDPQVACWLERSLAQVAQMTSDERREAMPMLLDSYPYLGQFATTCRVIHEIDDPTAVRTHLVLFCFVLAGEGKTDWSFRLAERLRDAPLTEGAQAESGEPAAVDPYPMLAIALGLRRQWKEARIAISRIPTKFGRCRAQARLAEALAEAGLYEEAFRTLRECKHDATCDDLTVRNTEEFIRKCERVGYRKPPKTRHSISVSPEGLRDTAAAFGVGTDPLLLAQGGAEAVAAMENSQDQAEGFLSLAWNACRDGELEKARSLAKRSWNSAEAIDEALSFQRALIYVRLADLQLHLDDKQSAARIMAQAEACNFTNFLDRGLATITFTPIVVSVYVRLGNVEKALDLARRTHEESERTGWTSDDLAWGALGYACGFTGQEDTIAKRMSSMKDRKILSILSACVACGIHDRNRSQRKDE